jgi:hypothetical protein
MRPGLETYALVRFRQHVARRGAGPATVQRLLAHHPNFGYCDDPDLDPVGLMSVVDAT